MPNRWIEFVRDFARRNDISYMCAVSKPECKAEYRAKYGNQKKLTQKKEREMMSGEDRNIKPAKKSVPFKQDLGQAVERKSMGKEDKNVAEKLKVFRIYDRKRLLFLEKMETLFKNEDNDNEEITITDPNTKQRTTHTQRQFYDVFKMDKIDSRSKLYPIAKYLYRIKLFKMVGENFATID